MSYWHRDYTHLFLLFFAAFFINLFIPRELWVQDEARYGEVLREMLQFNQWLIPHLNGHPYPDKPAFYFWVVAAVNYIIPHQESAFRLTSVLSTLLTASGIYLVAKTLFDRVTAFWSSAIFVTLFLTLLVGQIVRMDMMLAASVIYALYGLLLFNQQKLSRGLMYFWFFTIIGIIIKGPIALLFTLLPAIVWMFKENSWRGIGSLRILTGVFIIIAIVALWIFSVVMAGNEQYLWNIWEKQLVGRAVNSWHQSKPIYFYLVLAPLLFMPWFSLMISGFIRLKKIQHHSFYFLSIFSMVPFILLSLLSGKLFIYLQPMVPIIAIVSGYGASQLIDREKLSAWITWPPIIFVIVLFSIVVYLTQQYLDGSIIGYIISAIFLVSFLYALFLTRVSAKKWLHGWLINSVIVSLLIFGGLLYLVNPLFSGKSLGEFVAHQSGKNLPIGVVHSTRGILNFYAKRKFTELTHLETMSWWQKNQQGVLIIKTESIEPVFGSAGLPSSCQVDKVFMVELKEYHVLAKCI